MRRDRYSFLSSIPNLLCACIRRLERYRTESSLNIILYSTCLNTIINSKVSLFRSIGSVEANLEVLALINSNTTREAEALNHLVEGLDSGILEELNVSAIRVLGKQFKP